MLRLRSITKRFGAQTVLDALDLELPFEGVTFVMGRSGAGKSVLARVAVGLLKPDAGELWLGEARVDRLGERARARTRATLAYVAQGPALLDWLSLRENVALGPARARRLAWPLALERADAALVEVGLEALSARMPTEVGPGVHKRISVARALACGPQALVYDEPTTGLDPRSARQVDAVIAAAADRGIAAIVVSHDLVSAQKIARRAVVLDWGKIGFDGTVAALLSSREPAARSLLEGTHG